MSEADKPYTGPWSLLKAIVCAPGEIYRALRQGYEDGIQGRNFHVGSEHVTEEERQKIQEALYPGPGQ